MGLMKMSFYKTWRNMIARCTRKSHPNWNNYGGRGITVCDRWLVYDFFEDDMYDEYGYHLEEGVSIITTCTLQRIDNDKGYSKENCRWTTSKEQCTNRRKATYSGSIEWEGKRFTAMELAVRYGLSPIALRDRVKKLKWPIEKSLLTPPRYISRHVKIKK